MYSLSIIVKQFVVYRDMMNDYKNEIENTGDKIKAGAKAVGKKLEDPDRDLELEYNKEKVKEDIKDLD